MPLEEGEDGRVGKKRRGGTFHIGLFRGRGGSGGCGHGGEVPIRDGTGGQHGGHVFQDAGQGQLHAGGGGGEPTLAVPREPLGRHGGKAVNN